MTNLDCKRLQCDEIWSFVGCKERLVTPDQKRKGRGDVWTWTAIDPDTKLVPCWYVGNRDAQAAYHFMHMLAPRLRNRVQMTTDAHRPYLQAVEDAFGQEIDYAQLVKVYSAPSLPHPDVRYSPQVCTGVKKNPINGKPAKVHISTSICERNNLNMRMNMRRFTRLTNAFSKKKVNLEHSIAIHFMNYNFCRIHGSLRVTPAMQAGIADHVWSLEEVVGLLS